MKIQVVRPADKKNPIIVACGSGASFQWGDCRCND